MQSMNHMNWTCVFLAVSVGQIWNFAHALMIPLLKYGILQGVRRRDHWQVIIILLIMLGTISLHINDFYNWFREGKFSQHCIKHPFLFSTQVPFILVVNLMHAYSSVKCCCDFWLRQVTVGMLRVWIGILQNHSWFQVWSLFSHL